jgi:dipeptidyl aminopeptidase/acylaminoacyl peptidase
VVEPDVRGSGSLRDRGAASEYMGADNEGHSLARRENSVAVLARSARFLEQNMR